MPVSLKPVLAAACLTALTGIPSLAAADPACQRIAGTAQLTPDPLCQVVNTFPTTTFLPFTPAFPTCFTGAFTGSLSGTSLSGMTSATPSPVGVLFTAKSALTGGAGQLYTSDAGVIEMSGASVEKLQITGGTGAYAGATGVIFLTGSLLTTGGQYTGRLCLPKAKKHGRSDDDDEE